MRAALKLNQSFNDQLIFRERILGEAVESLAAELRLIDVANFIAYIHGEAFANLQDILNSSIELFFKPNTLAYGGSADCEVDWNTSPTIILDMEFRNQSVWVVFKLILRALETSVSIEYISFGKPTASSEQDTRQLIEALADARGAFRNH